jgi:YgiT-type zinc finger domain-containing protein
MDELAYKLSMDPVQLRFSNDADNNEHTNLFSMHAQQETLAEDPDVTEIEEAMMQGRSWRHILMTRVARAVATQVGRSTDDRRRATTDFGDCTFCGGEVEKTRIEYDYRRRGKLLVISNVSAGACRQCGEIYFKPDVLKKMDQAYIFDCYKEPERVLAVPVVSL